MPEFLPSVSQPSFTPTDKPLSGPRPRLYLKLIFFAIFLAVVATALGGIYFLTQNRPTPETTGRLSAEEALSVTGTNPQAIMILIEYKDTVGLVNFVNELHRRQIPGLLHLAPEFIDANCATVKELLKYDMEIMASLGDRPFWDLSYEDQKRIVSDMITQVEACTGVPVRIISSPYMASDMTTVRVAEELGIPYVTARGTTGTKASVYQIEGYHTKILSVSNIPQVHFKYGSLCDYSYYERSGTPADMQAELLRAIEPLTAKEKARYGNHHKVTPVTHTNIGGYLKPWTDMWLNFWDTTAADIDWVDLDTFMSESDWTLPDWQVPLNKNAPYTPEKIRPLVAYEQVEKVANPCRVEDLGGSDLPSPVENQTVGVGDRLLMFHNGKGPMCLEAIKFLQTLDYPVEQFLDTDPDFSQRLNDLRSDFGRSEGLSDAFGYYPMIFVRDRAFSGFNTTIQNDILAEITD